MVQIHKTVGFDKVTMMVLYNFHRKNNFAIL